MTIVGLVITYITTFIENVQYPGIFALMVLEGLLLPIPSEVVMAFSGYLIFKNELPSYLGIPAFVLVLIAGTIGNLVGALLAYLLGDKGGMEFVKIYGKKVGVSEKSIDRVNTWFNKYGDIAVFGTRLVPIFRTFISIPAGFGRMKISKFIIYTISGMIIWDAVLLYIGFHLGNAWNSIMGISDNITYAAAAAAVAVLVLLYYYGYRKKNSASSES
ncbi:MAG: DedA family protein [Thermoplasmataceae archaeon]|jgi:membrane protein DedA with SNARE-associated domain